MTPYTLSYMNRRGAGVTHCGAGPALVERMKTLRCEATLRDSDGRKVGSVEYSPGVCDDRRVKWLWSCDAEVIGPPNLLTRLASTLEPGPRLPDPSGEERAAGENDFQ